MNIIGLDISKVSTAMVVEADNNEFIFSYNTNKADYKWNKISSIKSVIRNYEYIITKDYSNYEINKLKIFSNKYLTHSFSYL